MLKWFAAGFLALSAQGAAADPLDILTAAGVTWTPEFLSDERAAVVEEWVRMSLVDPDKARFERMAAAKSDRGLFVVCGTVNGGWPYTGLFHAGPRGSDIAYFEVIAFGRDYRTSRNITLLCGRIGAAI